MGSGGGVTRGQLLDRGNYGGLLVRQLLMHLLHLARQLQQKLLFGGERWRLLPWGNRRRSGSFRHDREESKPNVTGESAWTSDANGEIGKDEIWLRIQRRKITIESRGALRHKFSCESHYQLLGH